MSGCLKFFGLIFCLLFFYYLMTDEPQTPTQIETFTAPKPDSTRVIDHFDWDAYKYVYKDEVPISQRVRGRSGAGGSIPFYPDAAVVIINGEATTQPRKTKYIIQNGKRYKIIDKVNGDQQLIEVR